MHARGWKRCGGAGGRPQHKRTWNRSAKRPRTDTAALGAQRSSWRVGDGRVRPARTMSGGTGRPCGCGSSTSRHEGWQVERSPGPPGNRGACPRRWPRRCRRGCKTGPRAVDARERTGPLKSWPRPWLGRQGSRASAPPGAWAVSAMPSAPSGRRRALGAVTRSSTRPPRQSGPRSKHSAGRGVWLSPDAARWPLVPTRHAPRGVQGERPRVGFQEPSPDFVR